MATFSVVNKDRVLSVSLSFEMAKLVAYAGCTIRHTQPGDARARLDAGIVKNDVIVVTVYDDHVERAVCSRGQEHFELISKHHEWGAETIYSKTGDMPVCVENPLPYGPSIAHPNSYIHSWFVF